MMFLYKPTIFVRSLHSKAALTAVYRVGVAEIYIYLHIYNRLYKIGWQRGMRVFVKVHKNLITTTWKPLINIRRSKFTIHNRHLKHHTHTKIMRNFHIGIHDKIPIQKPASPTTICQHLLENTHKKNKDETMSHSPNIHTQLPFLILYFPVFLISLG